ncbi:MAG: phosphate acyltransferase PlsX [Lachnospiraceae bacterium]|nr:phosphate acyltransferase PlsX [Lachnospiraceae bacterium]
MKTIVIDAMGGDYAPSAPVGGAVLALEKHKDIRIVLTGKEDVIRRELEGKTYDKERLIIQPASEVIENEEESPVDAIRSKKDSSMVLGLTMVKNKEADGIVSAGNTGAYLAGATFLVGRIRGISRPALTVGMPTGTTPTLLLDAGANMDCKPGYLLQFARMAEIYYRALYGVGKPSVGLLNVGVESHKGNELTKETYGLLKEAEDINFTGNCEARDVFTGEFNVVVTDAFAGNILLKGLEGAASYMMGGLKESIMSSLRGKIGGLLIKPYLKSVKSKLDPKAVGGCPLLGVKGAVIKAHGNSNETAIANAVTQCLTFIRAGVIDEITANMKKEAEVKTNG